ncbi:MAG: thioredoxin [Candidatus Lokiarchaeota archaeon]|nr:thioredoxin [Candidatus Lokiarchaeota archaeon]
MTNAETEDDELERIRRRKMADMGKSIASPQLPGDGKPMHLGSVEQFKDLIDNHQETPIIIDFWAEWCGPCRMLAPVFERLAAEYKGRAIFLKVNSDEMTSLAQYFRVSSIPDVVLVHRKEVKAVWIGLRPFDFYKSELDKYLGSVGS